MFSFAFLLGLGAAAASFVAVSHAAPQTPAPPDVSGSATVSFEFLSASSPSTDSVLQSPFNANKTYMILSVGIDYGVVYEFDHLTVQNVPSLVRDVYQVRAPQRPGNGHSG